MPIYLCIWWHCLNFATRLQNYTVFVCVSATGFAVMWRALYGNCNCCVKTINFDVFFLFNRCKFNASTNTQHPNRYGFAQGHRNLFLIIILNTTTKKQHCKRNRCTIKWMVRFAIMTTVNKRNVVKTSFSFNCRWSNEYLKKCRIWTRERSLSVEQIDWPYAIQLFHSNWLMHSNS